MILSCRTSESLPPLAPGVSARLLVASENWPAMSEPLGDKTFDDGFDEVPQGGKFALSGGDRRIEVIFNHGYPAVEIFAPGNDDVVGIEPMAAPTNALRKGNYGVAVPGRPASASFTIKV